MKVWSWTSSNLHWKHKPKLTKVDLGLCFSANLMIFSSKPSFLQCFLKFCNFHWFFFFWPNFLPQQVNLAGWPAGQMTRWLARWLASRLIAWQARPIEVWTSLNKQLVWQVAGWLGLAGQSSWRLLQKWPVTVAIVIIWSRQFRCRLSQKVVCSFSLQNSMHFITFLM